MLVYLAGKMRNLPNNNREAFALHASILRDLGHCVISPAELDERAGLDLSKVPSEQDVIQAFERDVPHILRCEAIALIPGWESSTLAPVEVRMAQAFGKKVIRATDGSEFDPWAPQTTKRVYGIDLAVDADQSVAASVPESVAHEDSEENMALLRQMFAKSEDRYQKWRREHVDAPTVPVSEEDVPLSGEYIVKDSGKREVMETGSQRDLREGKGRYDLLNPLVLKRDADLYEKGAKKYNARNWELGQRMSRYLDSAMRHLCNHMEGDRSEDHLAAVRWNIAGVMYTEEMIERGLLPKELDDRPDFITGAHLASIKAANDATSRPTMPTSNATHCSPEERSDVDESASSAVEDSIVSRLQQKPVKRA